jgi:hypothetical protein
MAEGGDVVPLRLHVSSRSGHVRIVARDAPGLDVKGADVEHDPDGTVRVVARRFGSQGVEVRCPAGRDAIVGIESGSVETRGELGAVRVTARSGRVEIESARHVDVRTASGAVHVGRCAGECRVVSKSSRVRIGGAGRFDCSSMSGRIEANDVGDALVRTMSGRVAVSTRADGRIEVRTLSGTVDIEVPRDRRPALSLKSLSGRVRCDCEEGDDGEVHVATTSGTIRVSCA